MLVPPRTVWSFVILHPSLAGLLQASGANLHLSRFQEGDVFFPAVEWLVAAPHWVVVWVAAVSPLWADLVKVLSVWCWHVASANPNVDVRLAVVSRASRLFLWAVLTLSVLALVRSFLVTVALVVTVVSNDETGCVPVVGTFFQCCHDSHPP